MVKKPERNELEYLRGLVREQKAQIRHLKRQLSRAGKKVKIFEETVELSEEADCPIEPLTDQCEHCGKGQVQTTDIGVRVLITCNVCDYKKSYKK
jgi:hypothetical protein